MVAIPIWCIGKHVTAVTITPQSVSVGGVLSDTTPVESLVGFWDEIDIETENSVEMIQASDVRRENDVIIGSRTTLRITEILKTNDSSGTPTNLLVVMAAGFDYFKAVVTRGGRTWTFYGLLRTYQEELRRGKSVGRAEISMVDPGAANPGYA